VGRYRLLGEDLIRKYNDGYVQEEPGHPREKGYSEAWLRDVLTVRPGQFELRRWEADSLETDLPY